MVRTWSCRPQLFVLLVFVQKDCKFDVVMADGGWDVESHGLCRGKGDGDGAFGRHGE